MVENFFSLLCIVIETCVVMGSNKTDLPNQYHTLQNAVNQSSLHANRQLKMINGNAYIAGFLLLVLALGVTYFLNVFEYWIPAVFLLFYIIFIAGLFSTKLPYMHSDVKDYFRQYTRKKTRIERRTDSCIKKNLAIVTQSLSLIFGISFFILLSVEYNWIAIDQSIEIFIPALTCLLFLPVPLFIEEFHELVHPLKIKTSLQKIFHKYKKSPWNVIVNRDFLKPFFLGVYLVLLMILPLVAFGFTLNLIVEWPYLLLIFLFQLFLFLLFAASFSANTVQKEFSSTINIYADIDYLLSLAQIHKEYSSSEYERLESLYQGAKPYDFSVLNAFKFINYYMLIPNRINLNKPLSPPRENFTQARQTQPQPLEKKPSRIPPPSVQKQVPSVQRKWPHPSSAFTKASSQQKVNHVSAQAKKTSNIEKKPKEPEQKPPKEHEKKVEKKPKKKKQGKVGILLYGPMLDRVSNEIKTSVKKRINTIRTPFRVELARKNDSYGGAPGLVPVSSGGTKVNAELLVFKDTISERDAKNMLYRMEHDLEGTKKAYKKPSNPTQNDFVIKTLKDFHEVDKVFYPSIGRNINQISPKKLAKLVIDSVYNTEENEPDGITYLLNLKKYDITTPMSDACEIEILKQTYAHTLWESREKIDQVNAIKSSIK